MNLKILIYLLVVMLVLGCTDGDFDDFISRYEWFDEPDTFRERYDAAVYDNISLPTVPEGCHENINSTKLRSIPPTLIIDCQWYGWQNIIIDGATCHQIPCDFEGAYCLECEER